MDQSRVEQWLDSLCQHHSRPPKGQPNSRSHFSAPTSTSRRAKFGSSTPPFDLANRERPTHSRRKSESDLRLDPGMVPSFRSKIGDIPTFSASAASLRSRSKVSTVPSITKYRTTDSRYRGDVLKPNGVYISDSVDDLPEELSAEVSRILDRSRDSPEEPDSAAAKWCKAFVMAEQEDEHVLKKEAASSGILPDNDYHVSLKRRDNQPFSPELMPKASTTGVQPISKPVPDLLYGYKLEGFTSAQQSLQMSTSIREICQPTRDVFWPFFAAELKIQATGGNAWFAANQCAGSGSGCSNVVQTLYRSVSRKDLGPSAFTASFDGRLADIFVHWVDEGTRTRFRLQRIRSYVVERPAEVKDFKKMVLNILDWGLGERLDAIRSALDLAAVEFEKQEDQARGSKKRARDSEEDPNPSGAQRPRVNSPSAQ